MSASQPTSRHRAFVRGTRQMRRSPRVTRRWPPWRPCSLPEIAMADDHLVATWKGVRIDATAMGACVFCATRSLPGTILAGSAVPPALRLGLGR
jgi:hypothetical protein